MDTLTEIQNTLRAGTDVKLSGVEITIALGRYAVPSSERESPFGASTTSPKDFHELRKGFSPHPPHTNTPAEIQNSLRAGTDVKLSEVEIVETQDPI